MARCIFYTVKGVYFNSQDFKRVPFRQKSFGGCAQKSRDYDEITTTCISPDWLLGYSSMGSHDYRMQALAGELSFALCGPSTDVVRRAQSSVGPGTRPTCWTSACTADVGQRLGAKVTYTGYRTASGGRGHVHRM